MLTQNLSVFSHASDSLPLEQTQLLYKFKGHFRWLLTKGFIFSDLLSLSHIFDPITEQKYKSLGMKFIKYFDFIFLLNGQLKEIFELIPL